MKSRRHFLWLAAAAGTCPRWSQGAAAQNYPSRPVRLIVGFAPGGPTGVFARLMAQGLSERLGKQFYVENIGGAGGNIAAGQAAKAAPDGYAILVAFSSYVVNPTLFDRVPYDPIQDFDPVTLAVSSTTVVTVNPAIAATTVSELVALIRAGGMTALPAAEWVPKPTLLANSCASRSGSILSMSPSVAVPRPWRRSWPGRYQSASTR